MKLNISIGYWNGNKEELKKKLKELLIDKSEAISEYDETLQNQEELNVGQ